MSREMPSNIQLLDMARDVLAVCCDHSLKDVLADLELTGSSELTINRIFDGQVTLCPIALPRMVDATNFECLPECYCGFLFFLQVSLSFGTKTGATRQPVG